MLPRPASTVVLLRDGVAGVEAYVLRRHAAMAFAAGMHAFPGGGVDPRDVDHPVGRAGWAGPQPEEWAGRLGCDVPRARGFVCAAVRETFEESGVLLAGRLDGGDAVITTDTDEWEDVRAALVARRVALTDVLDARRLVLRSELLAPWAHWVTPRFEERRYDTWFFLASLPQGQRARNVSGEADRATWVRPAEAVAAARAGRLAMLPPTWLVLEELARYGSVAAALSAADGRTVQQITPGWVDDGTEVRIVLPGDPEFPGDDPGRDGDDSVGDDGGGDVGDDPGRDVGEDGGGDGGGDGRGERA